MEITVEMVKELRDKTGAGVLDCRKMLVETGGDIEEAAERLREKGLVEAAERADREASEGVLEAYVHPSSPVAVLLELNCESDFVARTADFQDLAHDLALHIAFAAPDYLSRDDVPEAVIEEEKEQYRAAAVEEGKPERIIGRIVEGKLDKFYNRACLLEQPFVKNDEKSVEEVIKDVIAKLGENIVLRRFVRYELGEAVE